MGNRYLENNYAPVSAEITDTELAVTGTIPDHLDGRYLRNGPNPVVAPDPAAYHWFTGDGMVHGLRLRDGKAEWYRNRFVRSAAVAAALGEPVRPGPVHADMDFAANTNVIGHAGRTFAIVEAGARPYELTDELDTIGPVDLEGTLPGGYTAHPKRDPKTGELHAVSYYWGWGNKVQYSVIGTDGRVRHTVDVETTGSPMIHDCSLTESSVVIYDLPCVFDLELAMSGKSLPYRWDPEYPARLGVLPRDGEAADVRWYDIEPCYVFHPLNAYDDGDRIVLDVVRHPKMFAANQLGPNEGKPTLDRWTIDTSAGKVLEERIDDRGQEFPRVDERVVGRRHRFGYSVGATQDSKGDVDLMDNTVFKHDMVKGTTEAATFGSGASAGEFVFVPREAGAAEDDGVLMGFVHRSETDRSDLVLLDAATLETVAEIHLPARVPHGFHGNWIPT
ncbi:MAG: carotenoid cleavage oxygenase [Acidimicrobiaceae bacterium]|jgi:carotenoid cleavage dioxygenase